MYSERTYTSASSGRTPSIQHVTLNTDQGTSKTGSRTYRTLGLTPSTKSDTSSTSHCETIRRTKSAGSSLKSSSVTSLGTINSKLAKPLHSFYVWYAELCRRQNTIPVTIKKVKKKNSDQILVLNADRPKLRDWNPILNAIRLDKSLHTIKIKSSIPIEKFHDELDSEEKIKTVKKWFGAIATRFILMGLLKSLQNCLKMSPILTCLELDGLNITTEYLEIILQSLETNEVLKYLSFKSCPIGDEGCTSICQCLQTLPNIQFLNLSSCNLTLRSADLLSKLIKKQQINRCAESWRNSLRYEDIDTASMNGLVRITINDNPDIGDQGLLYFLNELYDDLWIKALDMQQCGVTDKMIDKVLDVIRFNSSLKILDLRKNYISEDVLQHIFEILNTRDVNPELESEFCWCDTTSSKTFGDTTTRTLDEETYVINTSRSGYSNFSVDSDKTDKRFSLPSANRLGCSATVLSLDRSSAFEKKRVRQTTSNLNVSINKNRARAEAAVNKINEELKLAAEKAAYQTELTPQEIEDYELLYNETDEFSDDEDENDEQEQVSNPTSPTTYDANIYVSTSCVNLPRESKSMIVANRGLKENAARKTHSATNLTSSGVDTHSENDDCVDDTIWEQEENTNEIDQTSDENLSLYEEDELNLFERSNLNNHEPSTSDDGSKIKTILEPRTRKTSHAKLEPKYIIENIPMDENNESLSNDEDEPDKPTVKFANKEEEEKETYEQQLPKTTRISTTCLIAEKNTDDHLEATAHRSISTYNMAELDVKEDQLPEEAVDLSTLSANDHNDDDVQVTKLRKSLKPMVKAAVSMPSTTRTENVSFHMYRTTRHRTKSPPPSTNKYRPNTYRQSSTKSFENPVRESVSLHRFTKPVTNESIKPSGKPVQKFTTKKYVPTKSGSDTYRTHIRKDVKKTNSNKDISKELAGYLNDTKYKADLNAVSIKKSATSNECKLKASGDMKRITSAIAGPSRQFDEVKAEGSYEKFPDKSYNEVKKQDELKQLLERRSKLLSKLRTLKVDD